MHWIFGKLRIMGYYRNSRAFQTLPKSMFKISNEVKEHITSGNAVVALESTIITHGMPYPENLRMALRVEEIVKNHQAIPATIGIINGKICVGMNEEELRTLASQREQVLKISRRDLPYVLSKGLSGGTTVAATMALAHRAGIKIFVTGGIGGVHKDGERTMDISADLLELSRTPMTIVSAGIKSILDIGRTLEFLETHGVCVTTFGLSREFPAFFTPRSGFFSSCNVETAKDAAQLINSRDCLRLESGILIGVPIPECESADGKATEDAICQALCDAESQKISGRDITPFVLKRVNELSGGASLRANIALIEHNAEIGSVIALELARIQSSNESNEKDFQGVTKFPPVPKQTRCQMLAQDTSENTDESSANRPVVIGGTILDITATVLQEQLQLNGSTHAGRLQISCGGVGRNIADCLTHLRQHPLLISAIGDDSSGDTIISRMTHMVTKSIRRVSGTPTAVYTAVMDKDGECIFGVGEMEVHKEISIQQVKAHQYALSQAPLVAIDGNIPLDTMDFVIGYCASNKIPVWFEPTDVNKAAKPFNCKSWTTLLDYASPNLNELREMNRALFTSQETLYGLRNGSSEKSSVMIEECLRLGLPLMERIRTLVVTLGSQGIVLITSVPRESRFPTRKNSEATAKGSSIRAIHYPAPRSSSTVSVSGAGDCLAAAMMAAIIDDRWSQDLCVRAGLNAAHLSLSSLHPVPSSIQPGTVFNFQSDFPHPRRVSLREE